MKDQYLGLRSLRNLDQPQAVYAAAFSVLSTRAQSLILRDAAIMGTMAQDLLETHPTAVITGDDGFYRVNYDQIDVDMMRLA